MEIEVERGSAAYNNELALEAENSALLSLQEIYFC
jgi:hypothetical protein